MRLSQRPETPSLPPPARVRRGAPSYSSRRPWGCCWVPGKRARPRRPPSRIPEALHLNGYEQTFGYSQAVKVGRTVYISATVAADTKGGFASSSRGTWPAQLDAVYANLAATLKAEGGGFPQVVMERIYTTDMDALLKVADRRLAFYGGPAPGDDLGGGPRLVDPGFLVAVEAVAELP